MRVIFLQFKCDRNRQFFDYWQALPRDPGALLPRRSCFLPEEVPDLLNTMVIYELVSDSLILTRLNGTSLNERFGRDITGENYLDFVAAERREKAAQAFWTVAGHPCGMQVTLVHRLTSGRDILVEALGLPFINDRGENPIVFFQSNEIAPEKKYKRREDAQLQLILVLERTMIDLGGGVPEYQD